MSETINKELMLSVGTTLFNGKYRIDQYLASGGFGNTYVATDTAFDEKVAIKELYVKGICGRDANSSDITISLADNQRTFQAHQEKFRKEARRLRKLSNDHIVHVHDLFDENNTTYYVMDYVEGESLSVRLKRTRTPMRETELMLILPQVLDALDCLHKENIWHMDLKPGNIMIDAKGNIQIIDFGASKQVKTADGAQLSTSTSLAYTPGFAPSEQMLREFEKLGPWTDLYALGATMFNLLTMQQPPTPTDIDENPDEAFKMPEGISQKTKNLIIWLMKPNRMMRPKSVGDVRKYLAEEPKPKVKEEPKKEEPKVEEPKKEEPKVDPAKTDDTVVKEKKKDVITGNPAPAPYKKIVAGIVILACVGVGFFTYRSCDHSPEPIVINNTTSTDDTSISVTDKVIKVTAGPENMRTYKYTGELASEDALPEGNGIAKFDKYGDVPASTYEGNFVKGVCEDNTGNATMTFSTGDKYVGTFAGGYYVKGSYTLADGSKFEGTFKNGSPYDGKWYNKDGSFSANVKDGQEQ